MIKSSYNYLPPTFTLFMKIVILHGPSNFGKTATLRKISDEIKSKAHNYYASVIDSRKPEEFTSTFYYRNLKIRFFSWSKNSNLLRTIMQECLSNRFDILVLECRNKIIENKHSSFNKWLKINRKKTTIRYVKKYSNTSANIEDLQERAKINFILEAHETKTTEKHIALFIDILGFSNILEKAGDDAQELEKIYYTLREMSSWFMTDKENEYFDYKTIKIFSDCLYISSRELNYNHSDLSPYDQYGSILCSIANMQTLLILNHGVFLRGGIAIGTKIQDNNNIEISSAYFKAVKIESRQAINPIIRLEEEAAFLILNAQGKEDYTAGGPTDSYIRLKKDGRQNCYYFVDYLDAFMSSGDDDIHRIFNKHKSRIIQAYEDSPNAKTRNKYRWLAYRYHNIKIREFIKKKIFDPLYKSQALITENEIPRKKEKELKNRNS